MRRVSGSRRILTATVLTVLLLLAVQDGRATVFLLLFLGILISLYLRRARRLARATTARSRTPFSYRRRALRLTIGALVGCCSGCSCRRSSSRRSSCSSVHAEVHRGVGSGHRRLAGEVSRRCATSSGAGRATASCARVYEQRGEERSATSCRARFGLVHGAINVFAVARDGDLPLAASGAVSRVAHRALPADPSRPRPRRPAATSRDSLRSWIVGQIIGDDRCWASLTAIGLYALDVPFWLPFGIFTGLVAIVPFFGTLVSTMLPGAVRAERARVSPASARSGTPARRRCSASSSICSRATSSLPLVMSKKVDLPPVLTIVSVLVMGQLLGPMGLDRRRADARRRSW